MPGLRFNTEEDYEAMSRVAAELIIKQLKKLPGMLLCVSAGGTPTRTYQLLASYRQKDPRLFAELRVLQIDEWAGVPLGSPARCETDLQVKLLEPLGISRSRYCGFKSDAANPSSECNRIARWLDANGIIDICILGLGINGHIAMNEPADKLEPAVHVARLSKSSQQHPLLRELSKKPRFGLSLGMGDILSSRQLLLLVSGKHKRAALTRLRQPRVTTKFPASFLWLHSNAVVLCDQEAASSSGSQK